MYEVDGLVIKKEKKEYIVSDGERQFSINIDTLEPSPDWFCRYETIKRILSILDADKQFSSIE